MYHTIYTPSFQKGLPMGESFPWAKEFSVLGRMHGVPLTGAEPDSVSQSLHQGARHAGDSHFFLLSKVLGKIPPLHQSRGTLGKSFLSTKESMPVLALSPSSIGEANMEPDTKGNPVVSRGSPALGGQSLHFAPPPPHPPPMTRAGCRSRGKSACAEPHLLPRGTSAGELAAQHTSRVGRDGGWNFWVE